MQESLRSDALAIWNAGLNAVRSDRLVREALRVDGGTLIIGEEEISLASVRHITVVGAGKAARAWRRPWKKCLARRFAKRNN